MTKSKYNIKWPKHINLTLEHNPNAAHYQTVEEYLNDQELFGSRGPEFYSKEDRQRSIDSNELWLLHFYPDTPIGFFEIAASSFDELIAFAEEHYE